MLNNYFYTYVVEIVEIEDIKEEVDVEDQSGGDQQKIKEEVVNVEQVSHCVHWCMNPVLLDRLIEAKFQITPHVKSVIILKVEIFKLRT